MTARKRYTLLAIMGFCALCGVVLRSEADSNRAPGSLKKTEYKRADTGAPLAGPVSLDPAWDRLPDGRISFSVFDIAFAFDIEDAPFVVFFRNELGETEYLPLKTALEDRQKALRFLDAVEAGQAGWFSINLHLPYPNTRERERIVRPFLGRFAWEELPATFPTRPIGISVYRARTLSDRRFLPRRADIPVSDYYPESKGETPEGFRVYPKVLPDPTRVSDKTQYILAGEQRIPPARKPLQIFCDFIGSPQRHCEMREFGNDSAVVALWQWPENTHPSSRWKALDTVFREILATVFYDRDASAFDLGMFTFSSRRGIRAGFGECRYSGMPDSLCRFGTEKMVQILSNLFTVCLP